MISFVLGFIATFVLTILIYIVAYPVARLIEFILGISDDHRAESTPIDIPAEHRASAHNTEYEPISTGEQPFRNYTWDWRRDNATSHERQLGWPGMGEGGEEQG